MTPSQMEEADQDVLSLRLHNHRAQTEEINQSDYQSGADGAYDLINFASALTGQRAKDAANLLDQGNAGYRLGFLAGVINTMGDYENQTLIIDFANPEITDAMHRSLLGVGIVARRDEYQLLITGDNQLHLEAKSTLLNFLRRGILRQEPKLQTRNLLLPHRRPPAPA